MKKLVTTVVALLLLTANAHAETILKLKPNSTYVHLYDVDLASEKAYSDDGIVGDGIALYTTHFVDAHEGLGTLHLSTKGIFFKEGDELLCGWKANQLIDCPSDLPLVVQQQKNGKLSIFVYAERLEKDEPVFHFRGKELFLLRGNLEKEQAERWKVVRTNAKGEIVSDKTAKPQ